MLVNLLDNALRYASQQPGAIRVLTDLSSAGLPRLRVWSDGAPLDQGVQRHLFEPFFSSESRSSGLGLYICRELCERHGALIGYQRAPWQPVAACWAASAASWRMEMVPKRRCTDKYETPLRPGKSRASW